MRIFHVLDKIENAIYNSRKVPLSDYSLIRRDKILNLIEKTRQELPKEMKQARWVTQENQRILQDSQRKAVDIVRESEKRSEELLKAAQEESRKRLDKEEIVVHAKKRAEELLETAGKEAETIVTNAKMQSDEIMKTAKSKAESMVARAKEEAEITRSGADSYALKILSNLESEFSRVLAVIRKSKSMISESTEQEVTASYAQEAGNDSEIQEKSIPSQTDKIDEKNEDSGKFPSSEIQLKPPGAGRNELRENLGLPGKN
jgi:cell division septum initiation protein DivIVA